MYSWHGYQEPNAWWARQRWTKHPWHIHDSFYINCACLSIVTFEDKKRENFERGNLELEKRRQALQEQQRKEQERLAALEREEQERKAT